MRTRDAMRSPKHQITAFVARSLPHWRLRMATLAGAASTSRAMAKLLGFQRCRPRYCSTYFEAIARKPPSANGQSRSTRSTCCSTVRSEAHTSELQSRLHLVCRLLLENTITLIFELSHTTSPLYYSNQHQYFLHRLAPSHYDHLDRDWLANTAYPTPLYSTLIFYNVHY